MNAEKLLDRSFLIDYAIQDTMNEVSEEYDDYCETDPYHFVDRIDEWLKQNCDESLDCDELSQKWLEDEGYDLIRERIRYFG